MRERSKLAPQDPRARWAVRLLGYGLIVTAVWLTYCLMHRELDFDEADYLDIARTISRTGVPWITNGSDLQDRALFVTSPPLAMLVAAATQALHPSEEFASRLVHALLFSLPIYFLVWHITWRQYGPLPAVAALLAVLLSPLVLFYGACVRPDSPLTLFSLLSLWCFYQAAQPEGRRGLWSLLAAGALFAAVWAKYQSICVPAAIGLYLGYLWIGGDRAALKRTIRPLVAMGGAGVVALTALYVYFYVVPGPVDTYSFGGIWGSYQVLTGESQTWRQAWQSYRWVVTLGCFNLGWLILPASLAVLPSRAPSKFTGLLVCFCLATILFNLRVHTSPGAGAWYLAPMVPAMAILIGRCVAAALAETRPARMVAFWAAVGAALLLQLADHPPWAIPGPGAYTNPPRAVGWYIRDHSPEHAGVLADTSAIEFYADRPTSRLQFEEPDVILDYLAGTSPCLVTHVVLRRYSTARPPANLAGVWEQCRRLLKKHFRLVPLQIDGIQVFERREIQPQ